MGKKMQILTFQEKKKRGIRRSFVTMKTPFATISKGGGKEGKDLGRKEKKRERSGDAEEGGRHYCFSIREHSPIKSPAVKQNWGLMRKKE